MSCFLCSAVSGESLEWYDRLLDRGSSSFVIPAVGSIAAGHVLVSPITHVNNVHNLESAQRQDFVRLLGKTCARVANAAGTITVFEHSAPTTPNVQRSACIDHAHVHVAPGTYDLSASVKLADALLSDSLEDFYSKPAPYDGYMMFTGSDGQVTAARDARLPQYLRRKIFEIAGRADEWDYALFPSEAAMRGTISLFEGD